MKPETLNVLIVEDSETDTQLLLRKLRQEGIEPKYRRVETASDFTKALEEDTWDIILCDYVMPHFSEPAAIRLLRESQKDIPFVVISGKIGEDVAVETMKAGANDYVLKGNLRRLVPAIKREVEEAKQREARRRADWALEYFIEALTHDLRVPLIAESQILELIEQDTYGPLSEQLREIVQELLQSNRYIRHMVDNILDCYKYKERKITLQKTRVDLNQFIEKLTSSATFHSMIGDSTAKIVLELDPSIPPVELDETGISRAIFNLVKNAIEHIPPDGQVTICTSSRPDDRVRVGVRDTGSGISQEVIPYIFQPYANTAARKLHEVSVGLGLYLSKLIIDSHGGIINFETEPGKGSYFFFDLPIQSKD